MKKYIFCNLCYNKTISHLTAPMENNDSSLVENLYDLFRAVYISETGVPTPKNQGIFDFLVKKQDFVSKAKKFIQYLGINVPNFFDDNQCVEESNVHMDLSTEFGQIGKMTYNILQSCRGKYYDFQTIAWNEILRSSEERNVYLTLMDLILRILQHHQVMDPQVLFQLKGHHDLKSEKEMLYEELNDPNNKVQWDPEIWQTMTHRYQVLQTVILSNALIFDSYRCNDRMIKILVLLRDDLKNHGPV